MNGKGKARLDSPIYLNLPDTAHGYTPFTTEEQHVRLLILIGLLAPSPSPDAINDDETRSSINTAGEESLSAPSFLQRLVQKVEAEDIALADTWGTENPSKAIHPHADGLFVHHLGFKLRFAPAPRHF